MSVRSDKEDRPATARAEKYGRLTAVLATQGLVWEGLQLFLRAFKQERILEVWGCNGSGGPYRRVLTYAVCAASGDLGPKRREGDRQVPEGFYAVDRFNPRSRFYLSLGLDYPNASDRRLGDPLHPGSDIFIHGGCGSTGCLAITDDKIKELYLLATHARDAGQVAIPVHIFPARLGEGAVERLVGERAEREVLRPFWENLKAGHDLFEAERVPPQVSIDQDGRYSFSGH